jgi:hypothetical protein
VERCTAGLAIMPSQDSLSRFFTTFNKVFPIIVTVLGLIGGNYLYKVKDQFKDDLIEELDERFIKSSDAHEYTPQVVFDVFKTRTNSAIIDVKSKADLNHAKIEGVLDRVERDVSEIKTDLKEYIRGAID